MRKAVFSFIALLLYCFIAVTPSLASDSWKSLPANTCPSVPVISACNLTYIMETNVSTLANLVSGANNAVAQGIGFLYKVPPVSGRDYLTYMESRFRVPGSPAPVLAAAGGTGFTSLSPILPIWTVMRNLAYLVFAVVFVAIGIMIITRSKIDPKTTVTIQNALPKIVLALILVTFSYAIAGFLVDLMYVAIALVLTLARSLDATHNAYTLGLKIVNNNIFFAFFDGFTASTIVNVTGSISELVNTFTKGLLDVFILGGIANLVTGGIAILVLAVAILWALFKTWLMLLSAYANIILGIIFSPIQLMVDAIPGQNQLEGWLRNMLSYLLAFPAVLLMFLIGLLIANTGATSSGGGVGFVPPLIGNGNMADMQSLIGITIILTIPKTVEILQKTLKAPENKWGNAWGEAIKWSWGQTGDRAYTGAYNKLVGGPEQKYQAWNKAHDEWQMAGGTKSGKTEPKQINVRPNIVARNLPTKTI